jgi:hypothetical protein
VTPPGPHPTVRSGALTPLHLEGCYLGRGGFDTAVSACGGGR